MPELAEVEYYRRRWNPGIGQKIERVVLNGAKRIFRGGEAKEIERTLRGATLLGSEAHGKQMLFHFSKDAWLGVHLGMTGELRIEPVGFAPGKHDHLVLGQKKHALVFSDARMFGRVRFDRGKEAPAWWAKLPPAVLSREFTLTRLREILQRRRRAPLKAVLLMQEFFPGVGNWMADEILWQARIHPRTPAGTPEKGLQQTLWCITRQVCRVSLKTIGPNWGDPPKKLADPSAMEERWGVPARWDEVEPGDHRRADDGVVPEVPAGGVTKQRSSAPSPHLSPSRDFAGQCRGFAGHATNSAATGDGRLRRGQSSAP